MQERLAAHELLTMVAALAFMMPSGLGQATSILVGQHLGENNAAAVSAVSTRPLIFSLLTPRLVSGPENGWRCFSVWLGPGSWTECSHLWWRVGLSQAVYQ